jgi:hypothetical protein
MSSGGLFDTQGRIVALSTLDASAAATRGWQPFQSIPEMAVPSGGRGGNSTVAVTSAGDP